MYINFTIADAPVSYEADICIIGSGAAGLALAWSLAETNSTLILLESGGESPTNDADELLDGENAGFEFNGLGSGRVRALGGTTWLWAGQCVRLKHHDFLSRDWIPNSGWPLSLPELEKYYTKAEELLDVDMSGSDSTAQKIRHQMSMFDTSLVVPEYSVFCKKPMLVGQLLPKIKNSKNVTIVYNATAKNIGLGSETVISDVEIASTSGKTGRVRAKYFVLACGGIENARLLLDSTASGSSGIGNQNGLVGKYLQDHPNGRVARVMTNDPQLVQSTFNIIYQNRSTKYWPKISTSFKHQKEKQVLASIAHPTYEYDEDSAVQIVKRVLTQIKSRQTKMKVGEQVINRALSIPVGFRSALNWFNLVDLAGASPTIIKEAVKFLASGKAPRFTPSQISLQIYLEQPPLSNNFVSLSTSRDALGRRKPSVHWSVGELEHRTIKSALEVYNAEFSRIGLGSLTSEAWLEHGPSSLNSKMRDAFHHAGTTRMATCASQGVVDENCRVHSTRNLFVAGSSVFPTSGTANPTFTIIALSLRLAELLKGK